MISVVTFLWGSGKYGPEHVNTLFRMLRRHCATPFRAIVVTAHPGPFDEGIETLYDYADFASLPSPHGGDYPSCYRRLRLFQADAARTFGEHIVQLDLDAVVTGDIGALWERAVAAGFDFVGWYGPYRKKQLCGSTFYLRAGSLSRVWENFDPATSPAAAANAGYTGSDQGYLSYMLPGCFKWGASDGVLSYKVDCKQGLPKGARIVFFHGKPKQDSPGLPAWVATHYQ